MSELSELYRLLMEIKGDIGALKQDSESSQRQRAALFDKTDNMSQALTSLATSFSEHKITFDSHVEKEEVVFAQVAEHEKVLSPFRDAKTKGLAVLAVLALMGGGMGAQAEKLLLMFMGK